MDIKESLGNIEQYWQIIRNLHFHIEAEGSISQEEYALIDKYLKVISVKYKALVKEGAVQPMITEPVASLSPVSIPEPAPVKVSLPEPLAVQESVITEVAAPKPSAPEPATVVAEQPPVVAEPVAPEPVIAKPEVSAAKSHIPADLQAKPAEDRVLSSLLEQMLDQPEAVPVTPVKLSVAEVAPQKAPSFNDKMMESRSVKEDLNSRIKKSMAESISLNEKFEFIRELFGNNPVEYASALALVDARDEQERAWNKLESEYAAKYKWDQKQAAVEKLKKALDRRYA